MDKMNVEFYMTCPVCLNTIYCNNKNTIVNRTYLVDCPTCMNTIEVKKH